MHALLKNRNFMFIWLGNMTSGLGNTFASFVMSFLVYTLTGSKLAMGGILVAFMVARSVSLLFSGPYLDVWNKKRVMVFTELFRALSYLIVLLLFLKDSLEVWHIVTLLIVTGLVSPLFQPSSMAYVGSIIPKEQLLKANSLIDSTHQLMMILGPALSALLVYSIGFKYVLLFLVLSSVLAGVLLLFIASQKKMEESKRESWGKQFLEGISVYKTNPFLLWMSVLLVILNFCKGAFLPMLLPYVTEHLEKSTFHFGILEACLGLGMVLGTLSVGFTKQHKNIRNVILFSVMLDGAFTLMMGWTTLFILALVCLAISGFCMPIMTVNNTTLYQKKVPAHLLGRVFAVRILFTTIGTPLGALAGGAIAEYYSLQILFTLIGGLMILSAALAFLLPSLRLVNEPLGKQEKVAL